MIAECSCTGISLPRLFRPVVTAFVAQGEAHGHQLAVRMSETRMFAGRKPDHPGIYHVLKERKVVPLNGK